MRKVEIESWALRMLQNVTTKGPTEDHFVELKGGWLPAQKLARRLAGHANSAPNDFILWLIGVDEKTGVVCGSKYEELSDWWNQMEAEFADRITPQIFPLNIVWNGIPLVAIAFKTDRVPYVVRNPEFGKLTGQTMAWEVPMRAGTALRTATRNDLITLLYPRLSLPRYELRAAELTLQDPAKNWENEHWQNCVLNLDLYVSPQGKGKLYVPRDRCEISVEVAECIEKSSFEEIKFGTYGGSVVEAGGHAIAITDVGGFTITAKLRIQADIKSCASEARIEVKLRPIGFDQGIEFIASLWAVNPDDPLNIAHAWVLNEFRVGLAKKKRIIFA